MKVNENMNDGEGENPTPSNAQNGQSPAGEPAARRVRRLSVDELKDDSTMASILEKYGVKVDDLRAPVSRSKAGKTGAGGQMLRDVRAGEVAEHHEDIMEDHGRKLVSAAEVLASLQERGLGRDDRGFPLESANGLGDLLGKAHFRLPIVHQGRNHYDVSLVNASNEEKEQRMTLFGTLPKEAIRAMLTPSPLMKRLAEEADESATAAPEATTSTEAQQS